MKLALILLDTLRRSGPSRLGPRLGRLLRYRLIYPFKGYTSRRADGLTPEIPSTLFGPEALQENRKTSNTSHQSLINEAQELCTNRFTFLNLPTEEMGNSVNWHNGANRDPLWQYTLHYGEWVLTLAKAFLTSGNEVFRDGLIRLIKDWIDHNKAGSQPGWEPYPISRRLVAWSRVGLALAGDKVWDGFWGRRLAPSLWQQARLLEANFERDFADNHLIANYRALAWMGSIFPRWHRAERWKDIGLQGLWAEGTRQILQDGVHYERSISYHTIVLQDLLEIWQLCRARNQKVPKDVAGTLERMLEFLVDAQAPDGSYPMVNDTVPEYPMDPRSILLAGGLLFDKPEWIARGRGGDPSYTVWLTGRDAPEFANDGGPGKSQSVAAFSDAGYVVITDSEGSFLSFDAGAMGPDHLPGHGHADTLSFTLHSRGRWLIVDSGVYSYHDKQLRDHFRSTPAHNTVTVDGQDQCVFWGPFRVAYPPRVRLLDWSERHVTGEHDGYCRLRRPVMHRRRIEKRGFGEWEVFDRFEGRGEHDFALTVQLAPGADAKIEGEPGASIQWPAGPDLAIIPVSPSSESKASIEDGWVSPGWNLKESAPRYVLRWRARVPVECRLVLKVNT